MTRWQEVGEQFYMEHQNELQNLILIDELPANYPASQTRPTIGCRALVRRSLAVLNAVLHEMEDMSEQVRLHAAKLLREIVIHSEDHIATKYFDINAVLCQTCADADSKVAEIALSIASLIGIFVEAETFCKYVYEELKVRQNKLGILKCMNAFYEHSTGETRFESLSTLAGILTDSSICHNNDEAFQLELMKLLETLVEGIPREDAATFESFYVVAMKSTAVSYDTESITEAGKNILKKLVCHGNFESDSAMHAKFMKPTLNTLDLLDKPNDGSSEQVQILYGIICLCGFQVGF